jgi:aspartate/methionine/tyrosine aminotransferase
MQYASERAKNLTPNSVFANMSTSAQKHESVNLGLGAPDFSAPDFLKEAAIQAIRDDINQYASVRGRPRLRQAIAERMESRYHVSYNPDTDIVVTQGATEAIFAAMLGLIEPGDEVILFEPCYTTYLPAIRLAGGIPKLYTFLPPDWALDEEKFSALFSPKTKMVFINTPHNPTGKVLSDKELSFIAERCIQHDVIAISDEVYDELIFDAKKHIPLCTYPGMYDRTITISSLGKNFGVTGWKVGWSVSSPDLAESIVRIHEYTCGSGTAPVQEAAAQALAMPQSYYPDLVAEYETKRNYLCDILNKSGLHPIVPSGTYFLMANFFGVDDDSAFCCYLNGEIGVTAVPASAFYYSRLPADIKMVRFAFCKKMETLEEAGRRLQKIPQRKNI